MASIDELLTKAIESVPPKPPEDSKTSVKKRYSEQISAAVAPAFAQVLRDRGLDGARPTLPGELGLSGAERRLSGAIGAKKVDITATSEESGLIFGGSIKSINWRDKTTNNFQKNLTNRRGDLLFESVTLHRRFPYSVLAGFLFLDKDAAHDGTAGRQSTFMNAHQRLKLFDGRPDPAGRDEQYERLYIALLDVSAEPKYRFYRVGVPDKVIQLEEAFNDLMQVVAIRNFDFYEYRDGKLVRV